LGAFYIALIWINSLLGVFLTPLFILPLSWLKRRSRAEDSTERR
jgi:predicted Na+-dependent transporter